MYVGNGRGGTFILMFCVCGIIASTQHQNDAVGLLEYAATAGLTVVVIIFSIGPISCAHVNPAVTIAFATIGQFPWFKVYKNYIKHDHRFFLFL
jgi:aquaporin NIP